MTNPTEGEPPKQAPSLFSRTQPPTQQWRDSQGTMHTVTSTSGYTDEDLERDELIRMVLELRRKMPTDEEMAFLRNEKLARERYAWAWAVIRQYAGWVVVITTAFASGVVGLAKLITWLAANFVWKG